MNSKEFLNEFYTAFLKAWNIFFEMPFPGSAKIKNINYTETANDDFVLYSIPIVGLVVGLAAYIFIYVVYFFIGPIPTSVICSLVVISFWEILTQGKDTNNLVMRLTYKWGKFSASTMKRPTSDRESNFVYIYLFIIFLVVRMLSLAFIIYHQHFGWVVITAVLVMSVQGHLASIGINNSKEIYIYAGNKQQVIMWAIAAVICILFSGFHIIPTLIAYGFILLLGIKVKLYLDNNKLLTGEIIGIVGKYTEVLVYIIGLIYITYSV